MNTRLRTDHIFRFSLEDRLGMAALFDNDHLKDQDVVSKHRCPVTELKPDHVIYRHCWA